MLNLLRLDHLLLLISQVGPVDHVLVVEKLGKSLHDDVLRVLIIVILLALSLQNLHSNVSIIA